MDQETPAPPSGSASAPPPAAGVCQNCGEPLYGKYCYACGQPATGIVRHFSSILSDAADSIFNVDERLFRTLLPLYLRPGRLTLDYLAGRRARYVTPFRLVFFLAIIAFLAMQISLRVGATHAEPLRLTLGSNGVSVAHAPTAPADADHVFSHGDIRINDRVVWNRITKPLRIGWLPAVALDWLNDRIANAQAQLHALNSGPALERRAARRRLVLGMFTAAPSVLFVLLPIFALMLKLAYLFRHRLYMEHLIVAMHSHAFLMLSMLVLTALGILNGWLVPHAGWARVPIRLAIAAAYVWILAYLWLAQKRIYGQGWLLTTVKYGIRSCCYSVLVGIGWAFAVLMSLTGT